MYRVRKSFEISAAHKLHLNYDSPCANLHGHNWNVVVECASESLDENGMVIDFKKIKELVCGKLDHNNLNEVFYFNPTAENIAEWISKNVPHCVRVSVKESNGNEAIYEI